MARGRGSRRKVVVAVSILVIAAAAALVAALLVRSAQRLTALQPVPTGSTLPVPAFRHVWVILLENKDETDVVGQPDAAYLGGLIADHGLATNYQAVAHPSQPNYLALFSGSTQGITDNDNHDLAASTIADQLEAAGRTWRVYAENLPADACYGGAEASSAADSPDGAGHYVRKHNPAISFTGISGSPARCANIQPLAAFDPAAAEFAMIVPNQCHIMHDCSVAEGDAWLRGFVPRILESPAWRDGEALFITFDEGADKSIHNQVATIVAAPDVAPGTTSDVAHSHYALLRTIQEGLGLPCLAESCNANTLGEFFAP
ncbi:MAG TPA: alkaline phosphatase family protein [Candidatus Limnocylindrales bacterium]|nr:alkaline phosphatase family protein [Candidatus Limnocylindrales bacterium]